MKKKIVERLFYNWFAGEFGEENSIYIVGQKGVVDIEEQVMGVRLHYIVKFEDGRIERIFNPNQVVYKEIEVKDEGDNIPF